MAVTHTFKGNGVKIALDGELGHHEAIEIMSRIGEIIDLHLPKNVVLDLSGLSFMDSSGIAVVVKISRMCSEIGAGFYVEGTPKQAMRIFNAAGIGKLIKIS